MRSLLSASWLMKQIHPGLWSCHLSSSHWNVTLWLQADYPWILGLGVCLLSPCKVARFCRNGNPGKREGVGENGKDIVSLLRNVSVGPYAHVNYLCQSRYSAKADTCICIWAEDMNKPLIQGKDKTNHNAYVHTIALHLRKGQKPGVLVFF